MAETIHQRIDRERKAAFPKPQILKEFRNYARGVQRSTLTAEQQAALRGVTGRRFCDNVCKMVLLSATQRLQLARFEVEDDAVLQWLVQFWTLTNLPTLSNQVHWATLRDGNHAVSLTWDNEKEHVRLAREKWWDGKTGIFIGYDDQDVPTYAVKEWKNDQGKMRRVVWWPDHIERYIAEGSGWRPFDLNKETPWTEKWAGKDGLPLGLPVVHFRNAYMPNDSSDDDVDTSYGSSELDGGVLGLQDEINDIQRDITSAARFTGYQMYWGSGVTLKEDENKNTIPIKVEPGAFVTTENPEGRYGVLAAGSLSQLEKALLLKLKAISRMTATPLHQITGGDWPSGEALLQADKPLVKKVVAVGVVTGPAWASVAHKATLLANAFGNAALNVDKMITTIFQSPEWVDELTKAQIADAIRPHVSLQEVLRVLGKDPEAIKKILEEIAQENKQKAEAIRLAQAAVMDGQADGGDGGDTDRQAQ